MIENLLKSIEFLKNIQHMMKIDENIEITKLKLKLRKMQLLSTKNPNFFKRVYLDKYGENALPLDFQNFHETDSFFDF